MQDSTACMWHIKTGNIMQRYDQHKDAVVCMRVKNLKNTDSVRPYFQMTACVHFYLPHSMQGDSSLLFTGSRDGHIIIWRAHEGYVIHFKIAPGQSASYSYVHCLPYPPVFRSSSSLQTPQSPNPSSASSSGPCPRDCKYVPLLMDA